MTGQNTICGEELACDAEHAGCALGWEKEPRILRLPFVGQDDLGAVGHAEFVSFPGLRSETWGTRTRRRVVVSHPCRKGRGMNGAPRVCFLPGLRSETWGTRHPASGTLRVRERALS